MNRRLGLLLLDSLVEDVLRDARVFVDLVKGRYFVYFLVRGERSKSAALVVSERKACASRGCMYTVRSMAGLQL